MRVRGITRMSVCVSVYISARIYAIVTTLASRNGAAAANYKYGSRANQHGTLGY